MDMWMVKQETNGFPNMDKMMKGVSCSRETITATNTDTRTHLFSKFPPTISSKYLFIFKQA
jgi:hypothetical protein